MEKEGENWYVLPVLDQDEGEDHLGDGCLRRAGAENGGEGMSLLKEKGAERSLYGGRDLRHMCSFRELVRAWC
jgi:hypothetical protein